MAIGNKKYCECYYGDVIEYAVENYQELYDNIGDAKKKLRFTEHLKIGLEKHKSKSGRTEAWHGVQVFSDGTWRPKSFYSCSVDYDIWDIREMIDEREAAAGEK